MTVSDAQLIERLANDPTGEGLRTLYDATRASSMASPSTH